MCSRFSRQSSELREFLELREPLELNESCEIRECRELAESFDSVRSALVTPLPESLSGALLAVASDPVIGPG